MYPQKKLLANPESRDLYSKAQQKPIKNAPAPLRVKWWGPKHLRPSYLCELNLYQKFQSSSTAPFDKIVGKFATTQCDEKGLSRFLYFPCVFGYWTIKEKFFKIEFYLLGLVFTLKIVHLGKDFLKMLKVHFFWNAL